MLRYQYATECDAGALYKLYTDPLYATFFRHYPPYLNLDQFRSVQVKYGALMTAYEGTKRVGWATVTKHLNTNHADLSVILPKHLQKQGYGPEITKDLARYLFNTGTNKLICLVLEKDTDTNILLKQNGFTKDCIIPESCKLRGEYCNEVRWSLKRETYESC